MGKRLFFIPQDPERLWGPPSKLCNGCQGFFSGNKRAEREAEHSFQSSTDVKKVELYIHFSIRLHGMMLNELSTGTTLPLSH
jgi:hypothetical protein